jgi:transcription antitermination factor NusG
MTDASQYPLEADVDAWYAIQVKRYEEHRVVHHLASKSVPTFLPLIESVRKRDGVRAPVRLEPLFPGYLFVRMPRPEHGPAPWDKVRWAPGVRRVLGIESTPVPMPSEAIDVIRHRISTLGFVRPDVGFAHGAPVRIRSGPLAGLEGIFDRPISRSGRVRVLLELLGQARRADLDVLDLESA